MIGKAGLCWTRKNKIFLTRKIKCKDYPVTLLKAQKAVILVLGGVGGQPHALASLHSGKRQGISSSGDWVGPRAVLDRC
jgi:hypothetical protein